ncbi:zinc finger MYM-type protein 1-like [Panicum virgatum]|uniref:zinc finger MYM-type protein 1-like n=1 Tax=Panicum virgatum TaxID=38727 RepID=UPI0019D4F918|nr:zinc finger MYM-type protein 1-like [Panicum virgatum]
MVVFQEHSSSGPIIQDDEPVRVEPVEPPIIEDDESSGDDNDDYNIEHDPGLRAPISSYPVNDQDSVRRAYIALGPCRPMMKKNNFLQHDCGDRGKFPGGDAFVEEGFRNWNMKGNFEEVKNVVLGNAPGNCQMIDHKIQKQLIASCAHETTKLVIEELGDECFAILADESSDAYQQEQLALCLRFVNKNGEPVEWFLGLGHVEDTTSLTLKEAIQSLLIRYQLPLSKIRGQGYDRASNMEGHANGLKKLIMDESPSAYYVHCFAHQLQLTLVSVAKENIDCQWFFGQLAYLLNVLDMSCKKIRMLRIAQAEYMIEALKLGEIESGQGLNQEMGLARPGDTRWGSHYRTVMHVMHLYPSIKKVLFRVGKEGKGAKALGAQTMLRVFNSFEFVFLLHLMNEIFGYTNDLCNALQKREQDIVNAMDLLEFTKVELDVLRKDAGWEEFLKNVTSFCEKHKVKVVDMDGKYIPIQRSAKFYRGATNYHRFHADMFLGVIDRLLVELNNRFDEVNTELLRCMQAFNPANSFSAFDIEKLVKLARFYPDDFDLEEINQLHFQLRLYIVNVRNDENFKNLKSLAELSMMIVKRDMVSRYGIVYKLLKLVLVLPVATASVERIFSAMNTIKNKLRSKMGQNFLNNCLTTFIERGFFLQAKDEDIIKYFQAMKERKVIL